MRDRTFWTMSWPAAILGSLYVCSAVIGALAAQAPILATIERIWCDAADCADLGLAFTGWVTIATPLLACAAVILRTRSARVATWTLMATMPLAGLGLTCLFGTQGDPPPHLEPLTNSVVLTVLASILGAAAVSAVERGRGPFLRRTARRSGGLLKQVTIAGAQVAALPVVLVVALAW